MTNWKTTMLAAAALIASTIGANAGDSVRASTTAGSASSGAIGQSVYKGSGIVALSAATSIAVPAMSSTGAASGLGMYGVNAMSAKPLPISDETIVAPGRAPNQEVGQ